MEVDIMEQPQAGSGMVKLDDIRKQSDLELEHYDHFKLEKQSHCDRYLKLVLGSILPRALSEICEKRPPDPIEQLARWLYQWADSELYYYEKAIFAKELQLMAIQIEKDNRRRLGKIAALKKQIFGFKYFASNEKALAAYMARQQRGSNEPFTLDDLHFGHASQSWTKAFRDTESLTTNDSISSNRQRRQTRGGLSSRRHRKRHSLECEDSTSDSSAGKRYGKKTEYRFTSDIFGDYEDYDGGEDGKDGDGGRSTIRGRSRFGSESSRGGTSRGWREGFRDGGRDGGRDRGSTGSSGRRGQQAKDGSGILVDGTKKGTKKLKRMAPFGDVSQDYISDTDSKGKFKINLAKMTPVRCHWYLAEPRVLVCVHPVLGEMRATVPTITPLSESPDWWQQNEYQPEVLYDHEVYSHPDPHFDDEKYKDKIELWKYHNSSDEDLAFN